MLMQKINSNNKKFSCKLIRFRVGIIRQKSRLLKETCMGTLTYEIPINSQENCVPPLFFLLHAQHDQRNR